MAHISAPTGAPPRPLPEADPYARHRIAPGFQQSALSTTTLALLPAGTAGDPVGDHLMLLAGAMGIETQWLVGDPHAVCLDGLSRLLLLNPAVRPSVISRDLAEDLARGSSQTIFTVADLTGIAAEQLADRLPSGLISGHSYRYYAYGPAGVITGYSPENVIKGAHREASSTPAGAEAALAAACVLADILAATGAYIDPFDGAHMTRSPQWELFRTAVGRNVPRRGLKVLIVGGGGALAHAFLEAVLADPWLGLALSGGSIVLVDPDSYETSNLSRQTLAGGPHNLGRKKAEVTAEEVRARWTGPEPPRVLPIAERFDPAMVTALEPDVIGLFPDNFAARAEAWQSVRDRRGRFVMFAGTEFTHGLFRAVVTGSGCCLDCGPEGLDRAAAREREAHAERTASPVSCGAEVTPSNVLTNAIVGALAALHLRSWLLKNVVARAQRIVNWMLPERIAWGLEFPPCPCWSEKR